MVAREAHNLEVGGSTPPSATNLNIITMNWKQEQEALENAFVRQLLIKHNIKEVTTQRQAINGTREFEFPVSSLAPNTRYGRVNPNNFPKLRMACFKTGYVRKQNGCYSPCLLYTSPSPRDVEESRMPSSA